MIKRTLSFTEACELENVTKSSVGISLNSYGATRLNEFIKQNLKDNPYVSIERYARTIEEAGVRLLDGGG